LQIYAVLLQAEAEAGLPISGPILEAIPKHLILCGDRSREHVDQRGTFRAGAFKNHEGTTATPTNSLTFLSLPWAIAASMRWLRRSAAHPGRPEETSAVRRTLGRLVVDGSGAAAATATSSWTFVPAEQLYGLSAVRMK